MTSIPLTVACPEALRDDANNFAMLFGSGPANGNTYRATNWQDADGNLYAVSASYVGLGFVHGARSTLVRPEWDTDNHINMAGAGRTQAALVVAQYGVDLETGEPLPVPKAVPGKLTAVLGADAMTAIELLGLSLVPVEDEV